MFSEIVALARGPASTEVRSRSENDEGTRIVAEVIFSLRVGALTKFTNLQNNRAVEQDDSLEILVERSTRMIDVF